MNRNSILLCLLFILATNFITPAAKAQVNVNDSLALVDLYNSTGGPNWNHHTNWLTANPVSTWYGITVTGSPVVKVSLDANNLKGTLPASIGNLTSLTFLDLEFNNLNGTIPTSTGNLTNLTYFDLRNNQLSGTIPATLGNIKHLKYLYLPFNSLSGAIPSTLGNLTNLSSLLLNNNQLTGAVPVEIDNLKNIDYINLSYNHLSGAIPSTLGNLVKLSDFYLNNNQLSGTIPSTLSDLTNLHSLYLSNNQLSGTIPATLGNLTKLFTLNLNNNQLSGAVPYALSKLTNCTINLSYNQLSQSEEGHSSLATNYTYSFIDHNLFTFDVLQVIAKYYPYTTYAPQDTILPIHQSGNTLSVSAGGTLSKNTYTWYKAGDAGKTVIKKDSTFTPPSSGRYYAKVTNTVAAKLTLYTDTISYTMSLTQTQNSVANVAAVKIVNSHFSVYPNPAKNIVHIQVAGNAIITLTNSGGKILLSKTINNSDAINISSFANGIYYIQNKATGEAQKIVVVH